MSDAPMMTTAMMRGPDLRDHYWIVGNKGGQVFSSARPGYVSPSDARYRDWEAGGGVATRILSDGELADVLAKRDYPAEMILAAGTTDWGNVPSADIMEVVMAVGCRLTSKSDSEIAGTYELKGERWLMMRDEALYIATFNAFPGGVTTREWPARNGTVAFSDVKKFLTVVRGLTDYLTSWRQALASGAAPPTVLGTYEIA